MTLSQAAVFYRERAGLEPTRRGPLPALTPGLNLVNTIGLSPPLPRPDPNPVIPGSDPDQGSTPLWPNGVAGEAAP